MTLNEHSLKNVKNLLKHQMFHGISPKNEFIIIHIPSQFMPYHYPRPKLVTNIIKNRNPSQPMK